MPSTITDEKSAIAQTSGVELQRYRARFENLSELTANKKQPQAFTTKLVNSACTENRFTDKIRHLFFSTNSSFAVALLRRMEEGFLRKLGIGGLASLLLVCLSVRVDAGFVNLNCTYPTHVNCRDVSWFFDSDGLLSSMYTGSPNLFITSRHDGRNDYLKTGDYLDKLWYRYLDKGQYYYLDRVQYKLLGGANYILGHPCYPKLFERSSEEAVGFTNSSRIYIPWYDYSWYSCFKTGDNIEKLRYRYLDKGRYYILDKTQYTWLGGLAYEFETPYFGTWHTYRSPYSYDYYCLLKSFTKGDIIAYKSSVPEPATIGLLGLGAWWTLIFRNKRRTKK